MVAHICDPKIQETEVEGLQVPSLSRLCSQICIYQGEKSSAGEQGAG